MSKVAQAKQEVSESPSKNAVNVPQNRKLVEKTVNQKLKVYGVIQAFKNGRFPDNKQIDEALVYAEKNSPVDLSKLSPDGKKLIKDLREIIAIMRQMVREKNSHEEFQNFLFHSMKADVSGNTGVNVPVSKDEAQKDKETAGEALRTLGTLFLKNGEARKLISDLGLVGRDMFADSAQFAAQKLRPDEEKLQNVDEPAPDDQFHDDIPDYLKQAQQKKDEVTQIAKEHANEAQNAGDPNASADHNAEVAANQAGAAKERVKQVIPDKHKEIAKEHKEKTKNYLKESFPEERRDQFIYRLKKVLVECQRHKDYQDAMDFFLTAFENYKGHANHVHSQVEGSAQNLKEEGHVDTAQSTFRTLIERFANGQSTQPIVDSLDTIYNDCLKDPELKSWFKKLDTYIRRCLQEPGFVMKDEANSQAKQLQEGGKKFFTGRTREVEGGRTIEEKGKYQPHFEQLFDNIATFFKAMGDDPLNKKFGQKWHKFGRDIFFNSEGNVTFKPQLWDDIRNPILPGLLAHVGFIPIARIEFKDPTIELVIENLNVDPANIIPNLIEIDAHTHHKMSAFNKIGDKHKGTIKVMLSQIQTDLRDVAWSINKKKGFPSLKDSGLADVFLGGNGLTVAIALETETNNVNVFKVKEVKAKIHKIDFAIRNSKHDLLVKILRPLATTLIKGAICKAAESGIRDALEKLNENLTAAKEAEQGQKMDVLKSRFAKKDTGPSQSEFKVPTSKRDSILPQMGDPNGWVKRIDKMDDLAASTGPNHKPDWHSPAFSIVPNASGTTPAQPNVSSRPNGR